SNGQKTKVRQIWTPDEDRVLSRAVAKETPSHGTISWHRVAAHLPGRNNKDCRKRWHYSVSHTIKKGTWTKDEDEKLLKAVEKYGARWSKVAAVVGSRNGDQCWKRWYDCLDPRIDKSPWTAEEDGKLLQAVEAVGRNWSEIVTNNFPNRTSLSAKNRYSILQRRRDHAVDAWVVTQKANASAAMPTDNLTPFQNPETSYLSPSTAASGAVPTGYDAASSTDSLQQSPSMIADNWYSDDLLSETSTPAFSPDLSWAQWSPCPSTLALS
ncbi:Homeodomain-like protein, partial [Echria macrotheca]